MFDVNHAPILSQDWPYLQMDRNELSLEPRHLGVPSGTSKMISEPMVRMEQTVHQSCSDINTVSKEKQMRFHMTHTNIVSKEKQLRFHMTHVT
jgi:hypothetical protein